MNLRVMKNMLPLSYSFSPRSISIALAATVPFILLVTLMQSTKLPHTPGIPNTGAKATQVAPSKTVYLAGAATGSTAAASPAPLLDMHIAASGQALIRGARVDSIRGTNVTARTAWGSMEILWTIHAKNASVYASSGARGALGDLKIGDYITINGDVGGSMNSPTIEAKYLRIQ